MDQSRAKWTKNLNFRDKLSGIQKKVPIIGFVLKLYEKLFKWTYSIRTTINQNQIKNLNSRKKKLFWISEKLSKNCFQQKFYRCDFLNGPTASKLQWTKVGKNIQKLKFSRLNLGNSTEINNRFSTKIIQKTFLNGPTASKLKWTKIGKKFQKLYFRDKFSSIAWELFLNSGLQKKNRAHFSIGITASELQWTKVVKTF